MAKNKIIQVQGTEITIIPGQLDDYISLTDIAVTRIQPIRMILLKTGCGIEIPLNCWVSGKAFTTPILNPSNSTGLENKPG